MAASHKAKALPHGDRDLREELRDANDREMARCDSWRHVEDGLLEAIRPDVCLDAREACRDAI